MRRLAPRLNASPPIDPSVHSVRTVLYQLGSRRPHCARFRIERIEKCTNARGRRPRLFRQISDWSMFGRGDILVVDAHMAQEQRF